MILWISNSGESLPVVLRMLKEGADVGIYVHSNTYKDNYDGIINKIPITKLRQVALKAEIVIFDITRPNEHTKNDHILLKMFGLPKNSDSVFGAVADVLKKRTKVIGGSVMTEQIEMDRQKGFEMAESVGVKVPQYFYFNSLLKGISFLRKRSDLWVFKPDNNMDLDMTYVESFAGELVIKLENDFKKRLTKDNIGFVLQKKIEGVEISTEMLFDGERAVSFNHTFENKKFLTGNLGQNIGSQSNLVWIKKQEGLLVKELKRMIPFLKKAGYIGAIDVNCIISSKDKKPYFLEWTPRFGYDALYGILSLVKGKMADYFKKFFAVDFNSGFAASERLTISPFPYSDKKLLDIFAKDNEITGNLEDKPLFWGEDIKVEKNRLLTSGNDGIIGVMVSKGNSIGGSFGNVFRAIKDFKITTPLQYRIDAIKQFEKRMNKLKQWKVNIS